MYKTLSPEWNEQVLMDYRVESDKAGDPEVMG